MVHIPSVSRLVLKEIDDQSRVLYQKLRKDTSYRLKVSKFLENTLVHESINNSLGIEGYRANGNVKNGEYRQKFAKLKNAWLSICDAPLTLFNQDFGLYSIQINAMLTDDDVFSGYRQIDVELNREIVGDEQISKPPWELVPKYMDELQELLVEKQPVLQKSIKKKKKNKAPAPGYSPIHPVEYSALVHQSLAFIHPFEDGTGRCARLVGNYYLKEYGLPCVSINLRERAFYFGLLEKGHAGIIENDPTKGREFYEFIASKVNINLERVLKEA